MHLAWKYILQQLHISQFQFDNTIKPRPLRGWGGMDSIRLYEEVPWLLRGKRELL